MTQTILLLILSNIKECKSCSYLVGHKKQKMGTSCSVTKSCLTLCDPMNCSMPGLPVLHYLQSLLKLTSIESVMPSNHLVLCCPLLLLPSIFPHQQGLFQRVSLSNQVAKVLELQH